MDELGLRTWNQAIRSGCIPDGALRPLWWILESEAEVRLDAEAKGTKRLPVTVISIYKLCQLCQRDRRTLGPHLDSLAGVGQIKIADRNRRTGLYAIYVRHAPPVHQPPPVDPQQRLQFSEEVLGPSPKTEDPRPKTSSQQRDSGQAGPGQRDSGQAGPGQRDSGQAGPGQRAGVIAHRPPHAFFDPGGFCTKSPGVFAQDPPTAELMMTDDDLSLLDSPKGNQEEVLVPSEQEQENSSSVIIRSPQSARGNLRADPLAANCRGILRKNPRATGLDALVDRLQDIDSPRLPWPAIVDLAYRTAEAMTREKKPHPTRTRELILAAAIAAVECLGEEWLLVAAQKARDYARTNPGGFLRRVLAEGLEFARHCVPGQGAWNVNRLQDACRRHVTWRQHQRAETDRTQGTEP